MPALRHVFHAFLMMGFVMIGCSDDDSGSSPTDSSGENNEESLTYTGTTGFIVDGDGFDRVSVDMSESSSRQSTLFFNTSTSVSMSGTYNGKDASLRFELGSGKDPGTYTWDSDSGSLSLTISLELEDKRYRLGKGTLILESVGAVGEAITGSIEGTLEEQFEDTPLKFHSRFSATRAE